MNWQAYTKGIAAIAGVLIPTLNEWGVPLPTFLTVDWFNGLLLLLTPVAVILLANKTRSGENVVKVAAGKSARSPVVIGVMALFLAAMMLSGCEGTRQAYQKAETPGDVAKVLVKHYTLLISEANDAAEDGDLVGSALSHSQDVVRAGQEPINKLKEAWDAWAALGTVENEIELEEAIADAAKAVADLIDTLEGFGVTSLATDEIEQDIAPLLAAA